MSQAKIKTSSDWDVWGLFLSGLCIIHCLLTPLILVILPSIVPLWFKAEGHIHFWFYGLLLGVAGLSMVRGLRQGLWGAMSWITLGLVVVGVATFILEGYWEYALTIVGSLFLVRGHYLCRAFNCHQCD